MTNSNRRSSVKLTKFSLIVQIRFLLRVVERILIYTLIFHLIFSVMLPLLLDKKGHDIFNHQFIHAAAHGYCCGPIIDESIGFNDEGEAPEEPPINSIADASEIIGLLAIGTDPNTIYQDRWQHRHTALEYAAQQGQQTIVKILLAAGANVDARSERNATPLYYAVACGHLEIVNILIAAGADVNARLYNHETILMIAAQSGRSEIARVLLAAGASVNAEADHGQTALMAASTHNYKLVKMLLAAGADVNASIKGISDSDFNLVCGQTALMKSADAGQTNIVKILCEAGADIDAEDINHDTAITLAEQKGHWQVVEILKSYQTNLAKL